MNASEAEHDVPVFRQLVNRLKGWTFCFLLFFSSFTGVLYEITPMLPLIYFRPRLWRLIMDRLLGFWIVWPGALMELLFGADVTIRGDRIEHDEPALIIMNHRTRLDWLFFWTALYKMDPWLQTSEKIAMKGILKYIPGAGQAMSALQFIFLDRQFDSDRLKLDQMVDYYSRSGYNYQLLFFPEGTDKCPRATGRSQAYAEKKGLVHYEQLLHPRTTGFVHLVRRMRQTDYIKYIYDVTIGYPDNVVQLETDLVLRGECPRKVQYQVRKIPIEAVPEDDESLAKWLRDLWSEKEDTLKDYYSKLPADRHFADDEPEYQLSQTARLWRIFVVVFWPVTTFFWIYAFFKLNFMVYVTAITLVIHILIDRCFGGIEWLAVSCLKRDTVDG